MENTMRFNRRKFNMPRGFQIAGWIIGGIALAVIFAFIFGYFVMLLWNWIMPVLFGLPEIDYWIAFGIILLARLIFGNFGPGHGKPDERHKHHFNSTFRKERFPKWSNFKKWHYYDDYWEEEGEEAFDRYIEKRKMEKKDEQED